MARAPTRFSLEIWDEITAEALIGDSIKNTTVCCHNIDSIVPVPFSSAIYVFN
ncbi:MAG: hypothetical protein Q8Q18_02550 [bacterium]|nr:hypothetical protein [bacterium]